MKHAQSLQQGVVHCSKECDRSKFHKHVPGKRHIVMSRAHMYVWGTCMQHNYIFDQIELPAKLLDYFLWSNKSNSNHVYKNARHEYLSPNLLEKCLLIENDLEIESHIIVFVLHLGSTTRRDVSDTCEWVKQHIWTSQVKLECKNERKTERDSALRVYSKIFFSTHAQGTKVTWSLMRFSECISVTEREREGGEDEWERKSWKVRYLLQIGFDSAFHLFRVHRTR